MKRPGIDGSFLLCLGINMILNLGWTAPAWILLICHFVFGISLWWFVAALALWVVAMVGICVFLSTMGKLAANCAPTSRLSPQERAAKDAEIRNQSANVRNKSDQGTDAD